MKISLNTILALLLLCVLLLSLAVCGKVEDGEESVSTKLYTDAAGRTVEVPAAAERVAVTGPLGQTFVFALCPDRLVGLADAWDSSAEAYLDEKYLSLPVLGQLYGGKGDLNPESLLASGAQLVIDVGEPREGIAEELDALQAQTGIPFVHFSMTLETAGNVFRYLGDLLKLPGEAEALADFCDESYSRALAAAEGGKQVRLLYLMGDEGLNVIAKDSYHAELLDLMAENLAVLEEPSAKGTGNEVDFEQLLLWDPDVILLAPGSVYGSMGSDPLFRELTAVKTGRYYEVPQGICNWMGFPPSAQRFLGMLWMGKLLYPEAADYDLYEEVRDFYKLFYHCELSEDQYRTLVANSIGKE